VAIDRLRRVVCVRRGHLVDAAHAAGLVDEGGIMSVIHESFDLIRTWESSYGEGFKLELYATYQVHKGREYLAYRFFHNGMLIFEGDDYGPSPCQAIDGDESVAGLLGFLACQPGDTDDEYFARYTPQQLEWAEQYGEELHNYVDELEGR
jgi:hypothetical protein